MINPDSAFAHPALAGLRTTLQPSPTAQHWLAQIDELKTRVRIAEPPALTASLKARTRYVESGWLGTYQPAANQLMVTRTALLEKDMSLGDGLVIKANPGESALVALHEGIHRVQRGSLGKFLGQTFLAGPVMAAKAGVHELTGVPAGGRTVARRFLDGVDGYTMRDEVEAYREEARVARELKTTSPFLQADGTIADDHAIAMQLAHGAYGQAVFMGRATYVLAPALAVAVGAAAVQTVAQVRRGENPFAPRPGTAHTTR